MGTELNGDYADVRLVLTPMLDGPDELLAGYIGFYNRECRSTHVALQELKPLIITWYRLLTLMDVALGRDHQFEGNDELLHSWHLRLGFASAGAATSKMVLDATLAGLYVQGNALARHMLEMWQRMAFVQLRPDLAHLWFNKPDGSVNREPGTGTIQTTLRKLWKDKALVDQVEKHVTLLAQAAHPTGFTLGQLRTSETTSLAFGGHYIRPLSLRLIDRATLATALILREVMNDIPLTDEWHDEFELTLADRQTHLRAFHLAEENIEPN